MLEDNTLVAKVTINSKIWKYPTQKKPTSPFAIFTNTMMLEMGNHFDFAKVSNRSFSKLEVFGYFHCELTLPIGD